MWSRRCVAGGDTVGCGVRDSSRGLEHRERPLSPTLSMPQQSHFWRRERRVSYIRIPICPHPLSLFFPPPSPLSVQVAKRTPAVGCSLSSPTHGQRSLELPQRATAPLAEDSTSQPPERREDTPVFFLSLGTSDTRIYLLIPPFFFS